MLVKLLTFFVDTLAVSYVAQCASSVGAAAEAAAARKHVKYAGIASTHSGIDGSPGTGGQRIFD